MCVTGMMGFVCLYCFINKRNDYAIPDARRTRSVEMVSQIHLAMFVIGFVEGIREVSNSKGKSGYVCDRTR